MAEDKTAAKNVEMLREYAARGATGAPRRIVMRFLVSPIAIHGVDGRVTGVTIERNRLVQAADGSLRPRGTGVTEELSCGMVLRSVGYRGEPLPDVPFDEASGTIPNRDGRVLNGPNGEPILGEYVVGWIKRGPSGVIGTNKPDAVATVNSMLADLPNLPNTPPAGDIANLLRERGVDFVTFADWQRLNEYETAQERRKAGHG